MRNANEAEITRWDELIAANPDGGQVLQAFEWGQFKARHGWAPKYVMHDDLAVLYLVKKVPYFGELWYAPNGPGAVTAEQLSKVVAQLSESGAFLVKLEPPILQGQSLQSSGLVKAPRDIQYNKATVIVNLEPSEEEILASFKQKTRYNIRYAAKHGVEIHRADPRPENLKTMYELMRATSSRAGFYLRSYEYFAGYWRQMIEAGKGQLFFARHEGQVLAGVFTMFAGDKALYKDGGSNREKSNLQAAYLLQWEVMKWLKTQGVRYYDLHGVPPEGSSSEHHLQSLVQFKTAFTEQITEFVGVYDLPLYAKKYQLWNKIGERVFSKYLVSIKKTLLY